MHSSDRNSGPGSNVYQLHDHLPAAAVADDLEVIVPAFNEESRIGRTVDALAAHLDTLDTRSTVRVIDNGSSDNTAEVVDRAVDNRRDTSVTVEGCSSRGKGNAVRHGVLSSHSRWVGFCDADLATPAAAITDALELLQEGWPVVIGSRHTPGARMVQPQPLARRAGGHGFRLLARHLGGTADIGDTQCGFKFFDADVARDLFASVRSTGFAFDVEVLARARMSGHAIKELPVEWTDQDGSTFRPTRHFPEVTRDLWRVRQHRRSSQHPRSS